MIRNAVLYFFALALMVNSAFAATKQDYVRELERYLSDSPYLPRAMRAVSKLQNDNDPSWLVAEQVLIVRGMIVIG